MSQSIQARTRAAIGRNLGIFALTIAVNAINDQTDKLRVDILRNFGPEGILAQDGTVELTLPDAETGLVGLTGNFPGTYGFDYRLRLLTVEDDQKAGRYVDPDSGIAFTATTVITLPDGETTQTYEQTRLQDALRQAGAPLAQRSRNPNYAPRDPEDAELAALIEALLSPAGRVAAC